MRLSFKTILFICFCFVLFGCNSDNTQQHSARDKGNKKNLTVGVVYDLGGLGDMSFNDGVAAGLAKANAAHGIKVLHVESKNANDFEANIRSLVEQNVDLVINVGSMQKSPLSRISKEFPNQKFLLIDTFLDATNVRSLTFKEHEGSFLAGYLSGLMFKKIGFVSGMKIPVVLKFYSGYVAGAKTANPNVEVLAPKFLGSWNNINSAKTAADILYKQGAEVIYQLTGRAGIGVLKSAKQNGKYAIGVDSDQDHFYPGSVLTSMVKKVDSVIFSNISDLINDRFSFGEQSYGLEEDAVALSEMKYTRKIVGEENIKKIERIKQKILAGKIEVPVNEVQLKNYIKKIKKT